MGKMREAFKRWIMIQPSHKTERLVAFEAGYQAAMTQERGDYRAALEYKSKREEALKARDLKCACDHNEYCSECFPLDFREGGMFYETPDSVMRNALAKYPRKADELEGKK